MKLKKILPIFAVVACSLANAQEVTVVNGTPFEMNKRGESIQRVLNTDRNDFSFLTLRGRKNFRVVSLDEKLKMDVSKELELPSIGKKEVKYVDAGQIGETTYFFSQYFDRKADQVTLYASDLDIKKGKFNEHYEAMVVKDKNFGMFSRPFQVIRSLDSTKIMFICTYPAKSKENARIAVKVTDNSLNELWKNDIIFDQENRDFTVLDYLIDSKGNLHMSVSNRLENKEKKAKQSKGRYYVSIYSYYPDEEKLKEYEIGFKDEIILTAHLELNVVNEIICTGFYAEGKFFDAGMKGFYFLRIDPTTQKVTSSNISPFDKKFLGKLMNERRAEKGKGISGYVVRNTYARADGGMTVVAEYYLYQEVKDQDGNVVKQIWTYGNVLVFFLDAEGKMKTYSILKKNQICSTKGTIGSLMALAGATTTPGAHELPYYGIGTMMKDDKLYLIYNENPKNELRLKEDKKPKSVRENSSETVLVIFEDDGSIESNVLFKSKDKKSGYKMPVMPRYAFKYSENGLLVIGKRGKQARIVDIQLGDDKKTSKKKKKK
ncbi:MAG: hypothetical protein P8P77_06310 [Crocinitomicaceae bacterium]|jgi:hypothetical protein|nr:hypothetical protein [Crocinitomicaceae bacterium]